MSPWDHKIQTDTQDPDVHREKGGFMFFLLNDFQGKVQESAPKLVQLLPSHEPGTPAEVDEFDVASGIPRVFSAFRSWWGRPSHGVQGTPNLLEHSLGSPSFMPLAP